MKWMISMTFNTSREAYAYMVGVVMGALAVSLFWWVETHESERTCESAQAQMLSLEQCLKFRPLCVSVEVADFTEYRDNKLFRAEHCSLSADGFQSEIK
jgi:hypothetical protein